MKWFDNTSLDRTQVRVEDINVVVNSEYNILSVEAYDMSGRKVAADSNVGRRHEISLEFFAKGIYVLNVTYTDGTREAFKITVIR